jgi:hypothetical protein
MCISLSPETCWSRGCLSVLLVSALSTCLLKIRLVENNISLKETVNLVDTDVRIWFKIWKFNSLSPGGLKSQLFISLPVLHRLVSVINSLSGSYFHTHFEFWPFWFQLLCVFVLGFIDRVLHSIIFNYIFHPHSYVSCAEFVKQINYTSIKNQSKMT